MTAADLDMAIPTPVPSADDPFALGWRYTGSIGDDWRQPLTEDDLVFPAEGDFVVNNLAHNDDRELLTAVFRGQIVGRPGLRVLGDHLIDFGVHGLRPLGPDVILLNGEDRPWDPRRGVFPVTEMAARPLIVVELASPSTRRKDLTDKPARFFQVGVPLYVLIDLPYGGGKRPRGVVAYQAGPTGYEPLPPAPDGRVWLDVVELWLAVEHARLAVYDAAGRRFADYAATKQRLDAAQLRADAERQRADAADAARLADQARLAALEAELRRLRGGT